MIRLDKMLAHSGFGTRKEVKKLIKSGFVQVNDNIVKKDDFKVEELHDKVVVDGFEIVYQKYYYLMLNKPAGYICAKTDNMHSTVFELLVEYEHVDLFCVGRLDLDTTGLLLLTNDGTFSHNLMNPKKKVKKVYEALVDGQITKDNIDYFAKGVIIDGDYLCLPASLATISSEFGTNLVEVIIEEGKFHQVKKMLKAIELNVLTLKRTKIKNLELDSSLELGEYRDLDEEEFKNLF